MRRCAPGALALGLLLVLGSVAGAKTLSVPSNDYPTIQSAISAADPGTGDVVEVAPGTYHEYLWFMGKGITVRATDPDPAKTIIDAGGYGSVVTFQYYEGPKSVLEGFTLTGGAGSYGDATAGRPAPARTAGPDTIGGGVLCLGTSPTIRNNIIRDNQVTLRGGGIACRYGASPAIRNNTIQGNTAQDGAGIAVYDGSSPLIEGNTLRNNTAMYGGGIWVQDTSNPIIRNNLFVGNTGTAGGGALSLAAASPLIEGNTFRANHSYVGGGAYLDYGSAPAIRNNRFEGNIAGRTSGDRSGLGGAVFANKADGLSITGNRMVDNAAGAAGIGNGGAIYASGCRVLIADNVIIHNAAGGSGSGWGGAIYLIDATSTSSLTRNVIARNTAAGGRGGGLYLYTSPVRIESNTFAGNSAPLGGGAICSNESAPVVTDSIVAFSGSGGGVYLRLPDAAARAGETPVRPPRAAGPTVPVVTYCDLFGNQGGNFVNFTPTGSGNLALDPKFVDPGQDSYRLRSKAGHWTGKGWVVDAEHSPCIDAGDPQSDWHYEPLPNGGLINLGYDGDTPQASKSYPQPDLMVRNEGEADYTGNDLYNTTGAGQTKAQKVNRGTKATYFVRLQNDARYPDGFAVSGTAGPTGWEVRYFDVKSGGDITSQVTGTAGWTVPTLLPQVTIDLRAEVTRLRDVAGSEDLTLLLTAKSAANPQSVDVVGAVTTAPQYQPDMLIRNPNENAWTGDEVVNPDGKGQTKQQTAFRGQKAVYYLRVENDSTVTDRFRLRGGGPAAWRVRYFDHLTGGMDITDAVVKGLWVTPALGADKTLDLRVEVTPPPTGADTALAFLVRATSAADPAMVDAVGVRTTATVPSADLMIRDPMHPGWTGEGLINATGDGQLLAQTACYGVTATYYLRLRDAAAVPDHFRLRSAGAASGWQVRFYDHLTGGADITAAVLGTGGWPTGLLAAGATRDLRLEVTAGTGVPAYSRSVLGVQAQSTSGASGLDVVLAQTTCLPLHQPDLMVRNPTDQHYTGEGIFNLTGENQARLQTVARGKTAVFTLEVANASTGPERFRISGPDSNPTVQVRYFDAPVGGHDITGAVKGWGWVTPSLAAGDTRDLRVEVTLLVGLPAARTVQLAIAARSVVEPAAMDVVNAWVKGATGGGAGGAQLSDLSAAQTAMGAEIAFALSSPAEVQARVLNLAGRSIRTLCAGQPYDAGANTLVWNAQSDAGLRVPSGTYLVEIVAHSADGSQARAVALLRIDR